MIYSVVMVEYLALGVFNLNMRLSFVLLLAMVTIASAQQGNLGPTINGGSGGGGTNIYYVTNVVPASINSVTVSNVPTGGNATASAVLTGLTNINFAFGIPIGATLTNVNGATNVFVNSVGIRGTIIGVLDPNNAGPQNVISTPLAYGNNATTNTGNLFVSGSIANTNGTLNIDSSGNIIAHSLSAVSSATLTNVVIDNATMADTTITSASGTLNINIGAGMLQGNFVNVSQVNASGAFNGPGTGLTSVPASATTNAPGFWLADPNQGGSGGSATNALIEGPAGIYDASLVTNIQATAIVGNLNGVNTNQYIGAGTVSLTTNAGVVTITGGVGAGGDANTNVAQQWTATQTFTVPQIFTNLGAGSSTVIASNVVTAGTVIATNFGGTGTNILLGMAGGLISGSNYLTTIPTTATNQFALTNDSRSIGLTGLLTVSNNNTTVVQVYGSNSFYAELNVQNMSPAGSSDLTATGDKGTSATNYIDVGFNGSGYIPGVGILGSTNDTYLLSVGRNLFEDVVGTGMQAIWTSQTATNAAVVTNMTLGVTGLTVYSNLVVIGTNYGNYDGATNSKGATIAGILPQSLVNSNQVAAIAALSVGGGSASNITVTLTGAVVGSGNTTNSILIGLGTITNTASTLYSDTSALGYLNSVGVSDIQARSDLVSGVNALRQGGVWSALVDAVLLAPRYNPTKHLSLFGNPFSVTNEMYSKQGFVCYGTNMILLPLLNTVATNFTLFVAVQQSAVGLDAYDYTALTMDNWAELAGPDNSSALLSGWSIFTGARAWTSTAGTYWASNNFTTTTNRIASMLSGAYRVDGAVAPILPTVYCLSGNTNGTISVWVNGNQAALNIQSSATNQLVEFPITSILNTLRLGGGDSFWNAQQYGGHATNAYGVTILSAGVLSTNCTTSIAKSIYQFCTDTMDYDTAVEFAGSSILNNQQSASGGTPGTPFTNTLANIYSQMNPRSLVIQEASPGSFLFNWTNEVSGWTNGIPFQPAITLLDATKYHTRKIKTDGPRNDGFLLTPPANSAGLFSQLFTPWYTNGASVELLLTPWAYNTSQTSNLNWIATAYAICTNFPLLALRPINQLWTSNFLALASQDTPPVHPDMTNIFGHLANVMLAAAVDGNQVPLGSMQQYFGVNSGALPDAFTNTSMANLPFVVTDPYGKQYNTLDGSGLTNLLQGPIVTASGNASVTASTNGSGQITYNVVGGAGSGGNANTNLSQYWTAAQYLTNTGNTFVGTFIGLVFSNMTQTATGAVTVVNNTIVDDDRLMVSATGGAATNLALLPIPSGAANGWVFTLTNTTTGQGTWSNNPAGGSTPNAATTNSALVQNWSNTNVFNGPTTVSNNLVVSTNFTAVVITNTPSIYGQNGLLLSGNGNNILLSGPVFVSGQLSANGTGRSIGSGGAWATAYIGNIYATTNVFAGGLTATNGIFDYPIPGTTNAPLTINSTNGTPGFWVDTNNVVNGNGAGLTNVFQSARMQQVYILNVPIGAAGSINFIPSDGYGYVAGGPNYTVDCPMPPGTYRSVYSQLHSANLIANTNIVWQLFTNNSGASSGTYSGITFTNVGPQTSGTMTIANYTFPTPIYIPTNTAGYWQATNTTAGGVINACYGSVLLLGTPQ